MVGFPIKCLVLFTILSLPLAASGQLDEKVNDTSFNVSVVVNDLNGNPISNALIKAIDPSGSPVLKQTDSKGRVNIEIAKNSNLNVKATGYRDWVSQEPISPGMLMLTIENEPTNTNFHIQNTKNNAISNAFVIIEDSAGNQIVRISDANGKASAQVSLGRANITIKAEGYEDFNENPVIAENASYTYVLNRSIGSSIVVLHLIVLLLPFLSMLYVSLIRWPEKNERYRWYAYTPTLGWVISFIALIIAAFYLTKDYNIYFLDPMLKVSLFVPIAAFLGATSYITVSLLKNIERKPPDSEWKLIYAAYGRRLLMAPYIAIIALFTITVAAQLQNPWAILFFSYFVGLYTKQIEGTLEEIGKKFLTEKQKIELTERDMKASEIVKRLGMSTSIASKLDTLGISEVSDVMAIPKVEETADKAGIDKEYLTKLKEKAKRQVEDVEAMRKDLGIDCVSLSKLMDIEIYSKEDMMAIPDAKVQEIADKAGIDVTYLKDLKEKAKK